MDYDATDLPTGYDRARSRSPEVMRRWMEEVRRHVPTASMTRPVLDIGCGTGRFSGALAEALACPVLGVDPSYRMLQQATRKPSATTAFVQARAEAIPVRTATFGVVFMSMVFHHLEDRHSALAELVRVLAPGGVFFLRTGSREEARTYPAAKFFPSSVPLMEEVLPSRTEIRAAFEAVGLRPEYGGQLHQEIAPTLADFEKRVAAGGDSVLARLSEAELAEGLQRVREASLTYDPQPVTERIDVFVFSA